jgi:class 3 adenylate cyclase
MRESVGQLTENWRRRGHELGFGVGISVGYATLGGIGFDQRRDYGAVGSVVNMASRLCDEAEAGQILVSQRVFGVVEPLVEASPLPAMNLKGFSRPVQVFNVAALKPA